MVPVAIKLMLNLKRKNPKKHKLLREQKANILVQNNPLL